VTTSSSFDVDDAGTAGGQPEFEQQRVHASIEPRQRRAATVGTL
jgi:hypothetical protein